MLWVYPELYETIEQHIQCDSVTFRYLYLSKVDRWYAENCGSAAPVDALQSEVFRLLTDCGPAEFMYWEPRLIRIFSGCEEGPASQGVSPEQQRRSLDRWCARMEEAFPGFPLRANEIRRGHQPIESVDRGRPVDIERLRNTLEEIQAGRSAAGGPTCEDGYLKLPEE